MSTAVKNIDELTAHPGAAVLGTDLLVVLPTGEPTATKITRQDLLLKGGVLAQLTELNQVTSNPPTQAEVQAVADKADEIVARLNELLAALQ